MSPLPPPSRAIGLVDCNSMYASAEAIFRPWLRNSAIVVLSSNDGNAIARNAAAKALGIPMGAPWHEIAPLHRGGEIEVFSSNFALYQDVSDRIMTLLARLAPATAPYSIDEAWVDLSGLEGRPGDLGPRDACNRAAADRHARGYRHKRQQNLSLIRRKSNLAEILSNLSFDLCK